MGRRRAKMKFSRAFFTGNKDHVKRTNMVKDALL